VTIIVLLDVWIIAIVLQPVRKKSGAKENAGQIAGQNAVEGK